MHDNIFLYFYSNIVFKVTIYLKKLSNLVFAKI